MNPNILRTRWLRRGWRAAVTALLLAAVGSAVAEPLLVGRVDHVADGDTLTVTVDGTRHRIRLHQIDAPEHDQPGAREARRALARKVQGQRVRIVVDGEDAYGRLVGQIWLGSRDINRELVREGHAWAFRRYLVDPTLLDDEAAAREQGLGLWRRPNPVAPWQWRARSRAASADRPGEPPGGCRIKGNINRRGERIYHVPGGRHYEQTRIDTAQGERWFCSIAEAERAGWRRARE
jgi:endonuclease YncB( thermonuclease family)